METKNDIANGIDCVEYYPHFLPDEIATNVFNDIMKEVEFLSDEKSAIVIYGKKLNIPRKQCGYGDEGTSYKFSGVSVEGKIWKMFQF